jgi:hypothetical protein
MLASTVQFSTTTRTTPTTHEPARAGDDRHQRKHQPPTHEPEDPCMEGGLSSQDPTVRLVWCFHIFSSNPTHLPEPATTPEGTASRPVLVGPSTTNAGMDADTRRADHTHPAVFGEAP